MTEKKWFGTDGIRGRVGTQPISPDFMLRLGWAAGRVFAERGEAKKVLIGKDTRLSGYMFESALEAGLSAAGVDIHLLGPMPTPAIAYLTRTLHGAAGIVISASHNPHYDNGIKFFSDAGEKLDDETEMAIEAQLEKPFTTVESRALGKAYRMNDGEGRYIEFCKRTVDYSVDLAGLDIALDCANGATYQVAPCVFSELRANVRAVGNKPDGVNINVDCGSMYPGNVRAVLLDHGADVGIAFDGDGDRVIMVDDRGEVVDGDELLYIIAKSRRDIGQLSGPVVGTLMSNLGLELALKDQGIAFERANVGDRYVLERLRALGGLIGGESSGHLVCLDRTTTGDGIVSALQVLEVMSREGKSLHELKQAVVKLPQHMINVPAARKERLQSPRVQQAVRDVEQTMGERGRVLLRPSGTEPVVRVMVEGEQAAQVRELAEQIAAVVTTELSDEAVAAH